MTSFPPIINLSGLDGSNGFQINGEAPGDASGASLSDAGDVNGDGFDDIIIGARFADPNGLSSGASYAVFGTSSGWGANLELSALNGANGFQISGEVPGDDAGASVSSAGDVNGDGLADLIIGAPGHSGGAAYVVFGKTSGFSADLDPSTLNGNTGFRITGGGVGGSVASAGDVNGDGFADLLVGNFDYYSNGAFLIFGKGSGFGATVDVTKLNGSNGFQIFGGYYGGIGASAGDVNGDGFDDVVMGDPYSYSFVVLGRASGFPAALDPLSLNGATGFRIVQGGKWANASGSGAGDVNGDGFADLIIGTPRANPNGAKSGASYVVFGKAGFGATFDVSSLDGANGFRINGEAAGDESGYRVSGAGDVNGDGFSDLIIGASGADPNGGRSGASYVIFGKELGFVASLDLSSLNGVNGFKIGGEAAGDYSGFAVSSAGDLNGDGFTDLLVGAPHADPNGSNSGASYVVFGHATETIGRTETSSSAEGDFNGDGKADVLWRNNNGAVDLWRSNPGSISVTFADQDLGVYSSAWHIELAADFNGDGKADVLWRNDNGDVDLWRSNPGSISVTFTDQDLGVYSSAWHIELAADFNGDGKADVLWRNNNGDVDLWRSNPGSVTFTDQDLGVYSSAWHIELAADFNGDGKADVLWRNNNGDVDLWRSNPGSVTFTDQDLGVYSSAWHIELAADFNGDGKADVLWRNNNGDVDLWRSNPGSVTFTDQDLGVYSSAWHIELAADFNGDGKADVLWRNNNGDVDLWRSNPGSVTFTDQDFGVYSSDWHIT